MVNVLCIGSAVIDIAALPIPDKEQWKEKQRIEKISFLVGGDAANQSVHLADAGMKSFLCASVGADSNGDMVENILSKRGVQTEYLIRKENISTGTSLVLVTEKGDRNTFSVRGAHSEITEADLPNLSDMGEAFPQAISLASLFSMPRLEREGLLGFLKEVKKKYQIPVFADLASDKLKQGLSGIKSFLPYISYFLPSVYDALEMTGTDSPEAAAKVYRACGCPNVVIKCGDRGCFFMTDDDQGWISARKVKPVDTTGAGDCMVALFVFRILAGDTVRTACIYACEGASISTLYQGANAENIHAILSEEQNA